MVYYRKKGHSIRVVRTIGLDSILGEAEDWILEMTLRFYDAQGSSRSRALHVPVSALPLSLCVCVRV